MRTTILLFLLSTIIVYGGLLLPKTLLIEQSIDIHSSSAHISSCLYDLPKWEKWLDWEHYEKTSDKNYIYSQFPQGVGAFMKLREENNSKNSEKVELYIQSIITQKPSKSDLQTLKYIANFENLGTHIEGEFEVQSINRNSDTNVNSMLKFTLEIDLGDNPFVRYLAYFYYKSKIEKETNISLEQLKKLCESPVLG
ncbi:hypothetical protein WAF17_08735 [Bernardetia sp. ABR2-2B]|uniref:hypothetical protein n=1 Tax=Bernardetia sp. ABR2-2B TaxID=3127472 RepID=UPI0030CD4659